MKQRRKQRRKAAWALLLVVCLLCGTLGECLPGGKSNAADAVKYTVEVPGAENLFLCNQEPSDGPVTLSYTVETATAQGVGNNGVVATTTPGTAYPYTSGSLQYHNNENVLMKQGCTYTLTMQMDASGKVTYDGSYTQAGQTEAVTLQGRLPHPVGGGNSDSQYFGVYIAPSTTVKLIDVTCVNRNNKNLGVQVNAANGVVTGGEKEASDRMFTNLSFRDYRKYGDGAVLGSESGSSDILAQTNRIDHMDGIRFTGKLVFSKTGLRAQELRIGGNYDGGANQMYHGIGIYINEGVLGAWNWYTNEYKALGTGFKTGEEILISMEFEKRDEGLWAVAYSVNGTYATTVYYRQSSNFGKYMVVGSGIQFLSAGDENEVIEQTPVSCSLENRSGYLVTGDVTVTDVKRNAVAMDPENPVLTKPGDYRILTTSDSFRYRRNVSLYLTGDVDLNGTAGEKSDLVELEKLLEGVTEAYAAEDAADYAADLDNDGKVGFTDLELMRDILDANTETTLETVKAKYHAAALSFDYLGGNEVMPIIGYYGPYKKALDYIRDDIFKKIKDSGINMINYSFNAIGEGDSSAALKTLRLAEKYGLGYFVDDFNLNPEYDASTGQPNASPSYLTIGEIAAQLGTYAYYDSYLGTHVADEPSPNGSTLIPNRQLQYFDWTANQLNQYVNTVGFLNLYAENGSGIFANAKTNYKAFCDTIVEDTDAKVLSFDDYPFAHMPEDKDYDIDLQPTYFKSLWNTRNKALEHNIPFWGYVQAGGDYNETAHATNPLLQVSEEECYWNVNTMLAFGAKGIEWFPCIQPEFMGQDDKGGYDYDRCGLIGIDGSTTTFYSYAQTMNRQIAAVDEVLMKATSTGIMATGSKTKSVLTGSKVSLTEQNEHLKSITAQNEKYGALVGCFDYRDTEAFYVVNYDTAAGKKDTMTLRFDGDYDVRVIQDAETTYSATTNQELSLTIPSGQAVLVVLENRTVRYTDVDTYRTGSSYRVPDAEPGYVFAGWFTDKACTEKTALSANDRTTKTAYAKFVPQEVMTVKAQLKRGTDEARDMRFVTTVDSLDYESVGFVTEIKEIGKRLDSHSSKVYTGIRENTQAGIHVITPKAWSGMSRYFSTCVIEQIPKELFDATIEVTPYWITCDGTKVYGDSVKKTVNEGRALEEK